MDHKNGFLLFVVFSAECTAELFCVLYLLGVGVVRVCCVPQVRKEYGKCLRTHCCSGKSVESSIGSGKSTASRPPGRYSTGSQVQ